MSAAQEYTPKGAEQISEYTVDFATNSDTVVKWCTDAAPEKVGLAIEFGMRAADRFDQLSTRYEKLLADKSSAHGSSSTPPSAANTPVKFVPTATVIGQIGEKYIYDILKTKFNVINTTKQDHQGDISLTINLSRIIVEVKNYKTVIPMAQRTKFLSDLSTTGAAGGIFVSLNTNISGCGEYAFKWEPTDCNGIIPCIYIKTSNPSCITSSVELINGWIQMRQFTMDPVILTVGRIEENLSEIAQCRSEIQASVADNTLRMMKTHGKMISLESALRNDIKQCKVEICGAGAAVAPDENILFVKYPAEIQNILKHIWKVCIETNAGINGWRVGPTKTKYTMWVDEQTSSYMLTLDKNPTISIPLHKLPERWIVENYLSFGQKITLGAQLNIIICLENEILIKELLD